MEINFSLRLLLVFIIGILLIIAGLYGRLGSMLAALIDTEALQ